VLVLHSAAIGPRALGDFVGAFMVESFAASDSDAAG
jgi:hypothetical protein